MQRLYPHPHPLQRTPYGHPHHTPGHTPVTSQRCLCLCRYPLNKQPGPSARLGPPPLTPTAQLQAMPQHREPAQCLWVHPCTRQGLALHWGPRGRETGWGSVSQAGRLQQPVAAAGRAQQQVPGRHWGGGRQQRQGQHLPAAFVSQSGYGNGQCLIASGAVRPARQPNIPDFKHIGHG